MVTDRITGRPRSLGRCIAAAAGVLLLTAGVAACGGGGNAGQSGATRLPSPSKPSSSRAGQSAANRRAARCHLLSAQALAAGVDRTKPVPCSQRHNFETIGTHPVYGKVDAAVLQQYGADCGNDVTSTLHIQGLQVVRVDVRPIEARTSAGHTVIRCDASLISGIGEYFSLPRQVTSTSLRQVAGNGNGAVVRWCTNAPPGPDGSKFVDCRRPHLAEVTGPWAAISVDGGYPARAVSQKGQAICRRRVARLPGASHLQAYGWWWNKSIWADQGRPSQVAGVCWVFRRDHKDLPALQ